MAMGLNMRGFGFIFSAFDLASPVMSGLSKSLQKLGLIGENTAEKLANVGAGLRVMAVGMGIAAAGIIGLMGLKKLGDVAGEFEYRMAAVKQITQVTDVEFQKLRQSTMELGLSMTQFAPEDAAEGLRIFAQAGFEANEAMAALSPTMDLAAASIGQLGLDDAAGLAVSGLKLFGLKSTETRHLMDRMAQATIMSSLNFKELPLAVGVAARGIIAVNATLEESLIGIGLVRNIIPTTERAATAFATSLEKISSKKSRKEIEKLGVGVQDLATGGFRPVMDIISDLTFEINKMGETEQKAWVQTVFGKRSMAGLFAMMRQLNSKSIELTGSMGKEGLTAAVEQLRKKMREADGQAVKLRDALLNTFKGTKQVLSAQFKGLLTVLGDEIAIGIAPAIKLIAQGISDMAIWISQIPAPLKKLIAGFLGFAAAAALVIGSVIAIKGLFMGIGAIVTGGIAVVMAVFIKVLVVIGLVGAAILVLRAAWVNNFGGIKDALMPVIDRVILFSTALFTFFKTGGVLSEEMGKKLSSDQGLLGAVIKTYMFVSRLVAFFHGLFLGLIEIAGLIISDLAPAFSLIVEAGRSIMMTFITIGSTIAEALGIATDTTMDWRSAGALVAEVVGGLARGFGVLFNIMLLPGLRVAVAGFKIVRNVIGPFINTVIYLGKVIVKSLILPFRILFALITGNFKSIGPMFLGLWDDIVGAFKGIMNQLGNIARGAAGLLFGLILSPLELLPESWRPDFYKDAILARDELLRPIDLFGDKPPSRAPSSNSFNPTGSDGKFFAGTAGEAMAKRIEGVGKTSNPSSPEIINITRVIVDGEILEETRKRYNNQERGRRGRVSVGRRGGY